MADQTELRLTARQAELLRRVVEDYVATGEPVGSRTLVERTQLEISASTVRAELAELERLGLLTHPHTSAGRVPTESGYRSYVDQLLERLQPTPASCQPATATSTSGALPACWSRQAGTSSTPISACSRCSRSVPPC